MKKLLSLSFLTCGLVWGCTSLSADGSQCVVDGDCESVLGVARGAAVCEIGQCRRTGTPQPASTDAGADLTPCVSTAQCTTELGGPAVCLKPGSDPCVKLTSPECTEVSANYNKGTNPVFVGVVVPTTRFEDGAESESPYDVTVLNGAKLAVEQWDAATGGGVAVNTERRPLVAIYCNSKADSATLDAVYAHLSARVNAQAMVVVTTRDALQIVARTTAEQRLLYVADGIPEASLGGVAPRGLVWFQTPSPLLEIPARVDWLSRTEARIRAERSLSPTTPIKVLQFGSNALGTQEWGDGIAAAIRFNGNKSSVDNGTNFVRLTRPERDTPSFVQLARDIVSAQPDVVIGLGYGAYWHQQVLPAIEAYWPESLPRPYYIMGPDEAANTSRWARSVGVNEDLRRRFQGTFLISEVSNQTARNQFNADYLARFSVPANNVASGFDALYVLGYSVAGALTSPTTVLDRVTGADFARQFARFVPGSDDSVARPRWPNQVSKIKVGLETLASGKGLNLEGTQWTLDWNTATGATVNDSGSYCGVRDDTSAQVVPQSTGIVYRTRTSRVDGIVSPACF